jgi:fructan beta-fructosidase
MKWSVRCGIVAAVLALVPASHAEVRAPLYGERYRPQFHFSPREGWIGDPDGLIRYRGEYHVFWWGHAVSQDLVHWRELPWPMIGGGDAFQYYTGSVVVDEANTGGWGNTNQPAMVAIYTAHEREGGRETQCLSISSDYRFFHYYKDNPVLNLNSRSFRDPDVFWDEERARWTMVIALPDERKLQFYGSHDLKAWWLLGSFGPMAARLPLWETPCLFRLPLDGDTSAMKWVLTCSLGPNKVQYFVGAFDGRTFKPDATDTAFLTRGTGMDGDVWEDFEGRTITAWSASGDAFARGPRATGKAVSGYLGNGLGSSRTEDPEAVGTLYSPEFVITRTCINFLVDGADLAGETCVNLLVTGRVVKSTTGGNRGSLAWAGWDVSPWLGREAKIQIVDRSRAPQGYIAADHFVFSDTLHDHGREHANWVDWGPDFYAARVYRDYDRAMTSTVWLGWMGNWDYANQVPTSWGRGALSIPRSVSLQTVSGRYALVQRPVDALSSLRGEPASVAGVLLKDGTPADLFKPPRNTYELEAAFVIPADTGEAGLRLCIGGGEKVVLAYHPAISTVTLDRRTSGAVSFSPRFPVVASAPLPGRRETLRFRVFVDQSSIEVFVNEGEAALTAAIFPGPQSLGVQAFSDRGAAMLDSATLWPLRSIWSGTAPNDKE